MADVAGNGTILIKGAGDLGAQDNWIYTNYSGTNYTVGYRASHPFDSRLNKLFLVSGTATFYNANPTPFTVTGKMGGFYGSSATAYSDWNGRFEDFASWPITGDESTSQSDPFNGYTIDSSGATATLGSDVLSNPLSWGLMAKIFVPSRRTAFVVPQVTAPSIPAGGRVYFDGFQLGIAKNGNAAPDVESAKTLKITVNPTRVNMSWCNSFLGPDFAGKIQTSSNVSYAYDDVDKNSTYGYSAKISLTPMTGTPSWVREGQRFEVSPGEVTTLSYYYKATSMPDVLYGRIDYYDQYGHFLEAVSGDPVAATATGEWSRYSVTAIAPELAYTAIVYYLVGTCNTAVDVNIDDVMIAPESGPLEYFHGSKNGYDYMWRVGTYPEGNTWSFYYQDFLLRNSIVTRLLRENVPLGVSTSEPVYGIFDGEIQVLADTVPLGESITGEGATPSPSVSYGLGTYGDPSTTYGT